MVELKKIIALYIEGTMEEQVASSPTRSNEPQVAEEEKRRWLEDLDSWTPRSPMFNWDYILARFATSVWKTAHTRYKQWHTGLPKRARSESDDEGLDRRQRGSGSGHKRVNRR